MIGKTNIFYELKADGDFLNAYIEQRLSSISTNARYITSRAFYGNQNLSYVNFPYVKEIGSQAFAYCNNLKDLNFPECIDIGSFAFSPNSSLEEASFPAAINLFEGCFQSCTALKTISLPVCPNLNYSTFYACAQLNSIYAPLVTAIGGECFRYCSSLEEITLSNVKIIPYNAFANCSKLRKVTLPKATQIGYNWDWTGSSSSPFLSCFSLNEVTVSDGASINKYAFYNCYNLETINGELGEIAADAFYNCSKLRSVSIRGALISDYAFSMCTNFETMYLFTCSFSYGSRAFPPFGAPWSQSLYVHPSFVSNFESWTNRNWPAKVYPIDESYLTTRIFGYEFASTSFSVLEESRKNISYIGTAAFLNCNLLSDIEFSNVLSIDKSAFQDCANLTNISLPNCTILAEKAFYNCSNLISIYAPNLNSIYAEAFTGCINLSFVSFPKLKYLNSGVFINCGLTELNFPEVEDGYFALVGIENLISLNLPNFGKSSSYANLAFNASLSPSLKYVNLNSLFRVYETFKNCSCLEEVHIDYCHQLGSSVFENCPLLKSFNLPNCTYLGAFAFYGCTDLSYVSFPSLGDDDSYYGPYGLQTINLTAFNNTKINELSLPAVHKLYTDMFYGVYNQYTTSSSLISTTLTSLYVPNCTQFIYKGKSCGARTHIYFGNNGVVQPSGDPLSYLWNVKIYVMSALYSRYLLDSYWNRYSYRIVSF